jgi:hypothetical protein
VLAARLVLVSHDGTGGIRSGLVRAGGPQPSLSSSPRREHVTGSYRGLPTRAFRMIMVASAMGVQWLPRECEVCLAERFALRRMRVD